MLGGEEMIINNDEQKNLIEISITLKKARIIAKDLKNPIKDNLTNSIESLEEKINLEIEKMDYSRWED